MQLEFFVIKSVKFTLRYIANLKNLPEDADETKNKSVIYKKDAKTSDEQQKLTVKYINIPQSQVKTWHVDQINAGIKTFLVQIILIKAHKITFLC